MAATAFGLIQEHNDDATVRILNLDSECDEELLWELLVQAGPLKSLKIVMDPTTGESSGKAFAEYKSEEDATYATKIFNMIKLFGKPLQVKIAGGGFDGDQQLIDIGANVYVGGLDAAVDEGVMLEAFSPFGDISRRPSVARDENGTPKGHGFIYFDTFDAADRAIAAMNGKFLMNKKVTLTYAMKKGNKGERHGSESERFLAQNNLPSAPPVQASAGTLFPANQYFSDGTAASAKVATPSASTPPPASAHYMAAPAGMPAYPGYSPVPGYMPAAAPGYAGGVVPNMPPTPMYGVPGYGGPPGYGAPRQPPPPPGMPPPPPM